MTQPITHDEMCASRKGRACNCGADKQPIAHALNCHINLSGTCTCGARQKAQEPDAFISRIDDLTRMLEEARRNLEIMTRRRDNYKAVVEAYRKRLADMITQRDEAQKAETAIRNHADFISAELRKWQDAAREGLAKGGAIQHPGGLQSLPADEGAIRAVVDAIENEHRHTEQLFVVCEGYGMAERKESCERMKSLAGLLERLCNQPIYMPRET